MEHKTYLGRVNHFSTESQLFQYGWFYIGPKWAFFKC